MGKNISYALSAVSALLATAWAFRVLEIASIFDRWLPGYTRMELFWAWVVPGGLGLLLLWLLGVLEDGL